MTVDSCRPTEILALERRETDAEGCFYCGRKFTWLRSAFPYLTREGVLVKACFRCILRQRTFKASTLMMIASAVHSPTTAEPQRISVAEPIIKHAKPLFFRNPLNNDVEGRRFMGAWKN